MRNRLRDCEIFPQELYVNESCHDLLSYLHDAMADEGKSYQNLPVNPIYNIDRSIYITPRLLDLLGQLSVFDTLKLLGYKLRENPRLISWTYSGKSSRGGAHHYHHDGWNQRGGQVSMMFLLTNNQGQTHMRLLEGSRNSFSYYFYTVVIICANYLSFITKGLSKKFGSLLLTFLDFILDRTRFVSLYGDRATLFVFNADQLHRACAVMGTTRTILHANFVKDYSARGEIRLANMDDARIERHPLFGLIND
jgi:hypothetical protein